MYDLTTPLPLPVIDADFPLPPRIYRGPATAEKYAELTDKNQPLAAIIQPGIWSDSALGYLAQLDLEKWLGKEFIPMSDPALEDIFNSCATLNGKNTGASIMESTLRTFPPLAGRDDFAACFAENCRSVLACKNNLADEILMYGFVHYENIYGSLHIDSARENLILRLPLPGAVGTVVDITPGGLRYTGGITITKNHTDKLAVVRPGDVLLVCGDHYPRHKRFYHARPVTPAGKTPNVVLTCNLR